MLFDLTLKSLNKIYQTNTRWVSEPYQGTSKTFIVLIPFLTFASHFSHSFFFSFVSTTPFNQFAQNNYPKSPFFFNFQNKTTGANKSKINKNNRTNQNKTSIPSPTANQIITKIDNRRKIHLPQILKIPLPVPITPKNLPKLILQNQPNNSPTPTSPVLQDQNSDFSGDQFSETYNFFKL